MRRYIMTKHFEIYFGCWGYFSFFLDSHICSRLLFPYIVLIFRITGRTFEKHIFLGAYQYLTRFHGLGGLGLALKEKRKKERRQRKDRVILFRRYVKRSIFFFFYYISEVEEWNTVVGPDSDGTRSQGCIRWKCIEGKSPWRGGTNLQEGRCRWNCDRVGPGVAKGIFRRRKEENIWLKE